MPIKLMPINDPRDWDDACICEAFDNSPNLSLRELAQYTGRSVPEIKSILLKG